MLASGPNVALGGVKWSNVTLANDKVFVGNDPDKSGAAKLGAVAQ